MQTEVQIQLALGQLKGHVGCRKRVNIFYTRESLPVCIASNAIWINPKPFAFKMIKYECGAKNSVLCNLSKVQSSLTYFIVARLINQFGRLIGANKAFYKPSVSVE